MKGGLVILAWFALGVGCAVDNPQQDGSAVAARPCGIEQCTADQFCVATQGALCMPLPPEGEACDDGCVRTEHCCNCTTHACLTAPEDPCQNGPTCACLESHGDALLRFCPADRRTCDDTASGAEVLCVAVALDEDPFAE